MAAQLRRAAAPRWSRAARSTSLPTLATSPAWSRATECLADVVVRMVPYWFDAIAPHLLAGKVVLVAAHGNSLRALIKHLDQMSGDDVAKLEIPTGVPIVYELDEGLGAASRPAAAGWVTRKPSRPPPRLFAGRASAPEPRPASPHSPGPAGVDLVRLVWAVGAQRARHQGPTETRVSCDRSPVEGVAQPAPPGH